jgi:uridine kinase
MSKQFIKRARADLLDDLSATLLELNAEQPKLVAIDGRSAAGKTTLADELALMVRLQGRPVLRCSMDDFHPPGHKYRSRERPYTPVSYYEEGYDYATFQTYVLDPVRYGSTCCRLAHWDSFNDVAFPEQWSDVPRGAIVIIDGIFLVRPDFRQYWDYTIWLQIDWETMIERAANRDVAWVGSAEVVIHRYRTFWIPTHTLYETKDRPTFATNVIVDNSYPETPTLARKDIFED